MNNSNNKEISNYDFENGYGKIDRCTKSNNKYGSNPNSAEEYMKYNEYDPNFGDILKKRKRDDVFYENDKESMIFSKKKIKDDN